MNSAHVSNLATRPEVGKKKKLDPQGRSQIGIKFINQEKPSPAFVQGYRYGVSSVVNSILNFHIPLKTQSDENPNNIIQLCNSVFYQF